MNRQEKNSREIEVVTEDSEETDVSKKRRKKIGED